MPLVIAGRTAGVGSSMLLFGASAVVAIVARQCLVADNENSKYRNRKGEQRHVGIGKRRCGSQIRTTAYLSKLKRKIIEKEEARPDFGERKMGTFNRRKRSRDSGGSELKVGAWPGGGNKRKTGGLFYWNNKAANDWRGSYGCGWMVPCDCSSAWFCVRLMLVLGRSLDLG